MRRQKWDQKFKNERNARFGQFLKVIFSHEILQSICFGIRQFSSESPVLATISSDSLINLILHNPGWTLLQSKYVRQVEKVNS